MAPYFGSSWSCPLQWQKSTTNIQGKSQEEDAENDNTPEEATPSSAEMRFYMHCLQIGLERRGFDKMNEFEKLNGHV